jgi:hypothetical protein
MAKAWPGQSKARQGQEHSISPSMGRNGASDAEHLSAQLTCNHKLSASMGGFRASDAEALSASVTPLPAMPRPYGQISGASSRNIPCAYYGTINRNDVIVKKK